MVEGPQEPPTLVEGVPGDLEPLVLERPEECCLTSSYSSLDVPFSPVDMIPQCSSGDMTPRSV